MSVESIGTPALWIGFTAFVLAMLVLDLGGARWCRRGFAAAPAAESSASHPSGPDRAASREHAMTSVASSPLRVARKIVVPCSASASWRSAWRSSCFRAPRSS
jgi:hypothetical protein